MEVCLYVYVCVCVCGRERGGWIGVRNLGDTGFKALTASKALASDTA